MIDRDKLPELLRRCETGEPLTAICKSLGLYRNSVYAYFKERGRPLRSKFVYQPFKLAEDIRRDIAVQYDAGATTTQLAKRFSVSHKTVSRCVREFGFRIRSVAANRRRNGHPAINAVMAGYKASAAATKFGFSLTYEQFAQLITANCYYCGAKPSQIRRFKSKKAMRLLGAKTPYVEKFTHNGVDRLSSRRGYTPKNVVSCCKWCNFAKNVMTVDQFEGWVAGLIGHRLRYFAMALKRSGADLQQLAVDSVELANSDTIETPANVLVSDLEWARFLRTRGTGKGSDVRSVGNCG